MTPRARCLAGAVIALSLSLCRVSLADDTEAPPAQELAPRPSKAGFYLGASGGYALRTIYGVPMDAGLFRADVGGRVRWARIYLELDYLTGATREHLGVSRVAVGPGLEIPAGRVRLAFGFDLGQIRVHRVTHLADLTGLDLGFKVRGAIDLVEWSNDGAVFVGLDVAGNSDFWGPSFFAGVRAF